ncbi:MAG: 16S rRNA (guanine(966)-N(2))-methyltransferase RsmD [Pseudomonadota bacterium]
MRIIGGKFRGTRLTDIAQGDAVAHLRPTSDRVRESVFNLLVNGGYGDPLAGARVLDLFAGTGALGLEALSRGAAHILFVETGEKSRAIIRKNIDLIRAIGPTKLFRRDATALGPVTGKPFDLVFLDPPYGNCLGPKALDAAARGGWLAPKALIVWEENSAQDPPSGFALLDARRYGDTWITILRYDS